MQTTGATGHGDAPRATPPDRPHLVSLCPVLAFQTTGVRVADRGRRHLSASASWPVAASGTTGSWGESRRSQLSCRGSGNHTGPPPPARLADRPGRRSWRPPRIHPHPPAGMRL